MAGRILFQALLDGKHPFPWKIHIIVLKLCFPSKGNSTHNNSKAFCLKQNSSVQRETLFFIKTLWHKGFDYSSLLINLEQYFE